MLRFSSANSAADLAIKHCNLKKNNASKYVAPNFTDNNMEYTIAKKTSISPSHGDLKYLSYQAQEVIINVKSSSLCPASFLFLFFLHP